MSLFRKQPPTAEAASVQHEPAADGTRLFDASNVDLAAIYRGAKLGDDELDRVTRAETLLRQLPQKAAHTREIVEATFRAFGVDQTSILDAARKQLGALEAFIRFSHEQTQHILDTNAKRVAELQAEIERCHQASAKATQEGEDRARTVNGELLKVQNVLEFFNANADLTGLDGPTVVTKPGADDDGKRAPGGKRA